MLDNKDYKIAAFYIVAQSNINGDWEKTHFTEQINVLKDSHLYENIEFIDLIVKGKEPLREVPSKVNNIYQFGDKTNLNNTYGSFWGMKFIWEFCRKNPDYKILIFNSIGISSSDPEYLKNKRAWRKYLEYCNITRWKECIELLDYYDCVGTDYLSHAVYRNGEICIYAPHYQGGPFCWANASYIARLDPDYLTQNVEWAYYLGELWIGSKDPNAYNIHTSNVNHYLCEYKPDFNLIKDKMEKDLYFLKNNMNLKQILTIYNLNDYTHSFGTDKDTLHDYIDGFYEDVLLPFKERAIDVLEIGIYLGASMKLWREYFSNAKIYGIDTEDRRLEKFKNLKNVEYLFEDAYSDNLSINDLKFDVIIDDGPHTLESQIKFIQKYHSKLKKDSIMIIEDIADISYVPILQKEIPLGFTSELIDLRKNKNRFDDIILVIKN